jgi:hypothetical protein
MLDGWNVENSYTCTPANCPKERKIYVKAIAEDGTANSAESLPASITIQNTAPTTPTSIDVASSNGNYYADSLLTAEASGASDIDDDTISYEYYWYWHDGQTENTLQNWEAGSYTCTPANCPEGRTIYVKARAHDDSSYSDESRPFSIQIINSPPTITRVNVGTYLYGTVMTVSYYGSDLNTDTITATTEFSYDGGTIWEKKSCNAGSKSPYYTSNTAFSGNCKINLPSNQDIPNVRAIVKVTDGEHPEVTSTVSTFNIDNSCECTNCASCQRKLRRQSASGWDCNTIKIINDFSTTSTCISDSQSTIKNKILSCLKPDNTNKFSVTGSGTNTFVKLTNTLSAKNTFENCIINNFQIGFDFYKQNADSVLMTIRHNTISVPQMPSMNVVGISSLNQWTDVENNIFNLYGRKVGDNNYFGEGIGLFNVGGIISDNEFNLESDFSKGIYSQSLSGITIKGNRFICQ